MIVILCSSSSNMNAVYSNIFQYTFGHCLLLFFLLDNSVSNKFQLLHSTNICKTIEVSDNAIQAWMVGESFTSGPDRVCDLQSPEIFRLFRHIYGI